MGKKEKGDNSVMDLENLTKSLSGHLNHRHNLWPKYHDPSSSGFCDILFTSFQCKNEIKNKKGNNSAIQ